MGGDKKFKNLGWTWFHRQTQKKCVCNYEIELVQIVAWQQKKKEEKKGFWKKISATCGRGKKGGKEVGEGFPPKKMSAPSSTSHPLLFFLLDLPRNFKKTRLVLTPLAAFFFKSAKET